MAAEALDFLAPPTTLDQADGTQIHVLGVDSYAIAAGLSTGIRWWRPTNAPSIQCVGVMWLLSDPSAPVVSKNFNPATSGYNDLLWDTPIPWAANVHYIVAVLTNRYAFSVGGWPFQSTNLRADAGVNARLALNTGGALTFPSGIHGGGANFFVSPLFERTSVFASASLSAQSSMSVSARLTAMASASLSAQSVLSVSMLADQPPGVHVASGSAMSTLTATGTASATLTASGTP